MRVTIITSAMIALLGNVSVQAADSEWQTFVLPALFPQPADLLPEFFHEAIAGSPLDTQAPQPAVAPATPPPPVVQVPVRAPSRR